VKFEIPEPLRIEHELLHSRLMKATQEPGEIGEAAREVARLLHPHFVREEEFALPPLAVLAQVAVDVITPEMAEVLPMTRRLKAELGSLLDEHQQILVALEKLREAARIAGKSEHEQFAHDLVLHAQTEEQVLYPAAILAGEIVGQALR